MTLFELSVPSVLGVGKSAGEPAGAPPFAHRGVSGGIGLAKTFLQQNRVIVVHMRNLQRIAVTALRAATTRSLPSRSG